MCYNKDTNKKGEHSMITKHDKILVVDTETANTLTRPDGSADMSDVLVYDCGWQVTDREGSVYEAASYVNKDTHGQTRTTSPAKTFPASVDFPPRCSRRWQAERRRA